MTDQEIMQNAIGGLWPKEALPAGLDYMKRVPDEHSAWQLETIGDWVWGDWGWQDIYPWHAAALFRDSGMAWLIKNDAVVTIHHCGHHFHLRASNYHGEHNDSVLFLIDAAIRAVYKSEVRDG